MPKGMLATGARKCCVYLVLNAAGQVKVGRSSRLVTRLSELGVGCAGGVNLAHSWKLKIADAVALEREMHRVLKPLRISGEWFEGGVSDLRGVGELLIACDVAGAKRLVSVLVEIQRLDKAAARLSRENDGLINFHAARKRELQRQEDALLEESARAHELAIELGAFPSELDIWRPQKIAETEARGLA